jgi:predicted nucleotidyltransferase
MGQRSLSSEALEQIVQYLRGRFNPFLIILFGSAAQGRLRTDSDIDLAIASDQELSHYDLFLAAQELAAQLGREVDLVDLGQTSTVLRMEIFKNGRVILNGDNNRRMWMHMDALKEYARLNEERAPVLRRFAERRSEYDR